jgi:hypothetical protein
MANPRYFHPDYAPQPRQLPVRNVNSSPRCRGMDPSQTKIIQCFLFVLFAAAYGYFFGSIFAFVMYLLD